MKALPPRGRHGSPRGLGWGALALLAIVAACKSEPASRAVVANGALVVLAPPLPMDPDVRVVRFDNGVTFLSRVVPTNIERVVLALVVKAGSLVEHDDERGLAHFVEHMGFRGTVHLLAAGAWRDRGADRARPPFQRRPAPGGSPLPEIGAVPRRAVEPETSPSAGP